MMRVYCISLASAEDRRQSIQRQSEETGIAVSFVDAVDGSTLNVADCDIYDRRRRLRTHELDLRPNELACAMSHRKALQTFLATDDAYTVILEDDCRFGPDLTSKITRVAEATGFELLKLDSKQRRGRDLGTCDDLELFSPINMTNCAAGFAYSRSGASKVLSMTSRLIYPFDTQLIFCWRHDVDVVATWPPLVTTLNFDSDIGIRDPKTSGNSVIKRHLHVADRMHQSFMKRIHSRRVAARLPRDKHANEAIRPDRNQRK